VIDFDNEEIVSLARMASDMPRLRKNCQGKDCQVAPSTLHRWATKGVRGRKLETAFLGGVRVTSQEAMQRFLSAINQEPVGASP
jgi:hypothetical protein